jgi:hypothetical protein
MNRIIGALLATTVLIGAADAQIYRPGGSSSGGSFPPSGCSTANGVIFNNATPCDSGFTYAGSGGAVQFNSDVSLIGETTGVLSVRDGASQPDSVRIYHDSSSSNSVYSRLSLGFNPLHNTIASIDVEAATSALPNFGIYIGGTIQLDYGITRASVWTFGSSIYFGHSAGLTSPTDGEIDIVNNNSTSYFRLSTPGANLFQFGAANVNGAPVAQTISFQGALAGSASNQASANTTIIGSLGTGTGTNGNLIFQVGVKTTTGTAQATATTALTLTGETLLAAFGGAVTTVGTVTVGTVNSATGLFVCETAGLLSSGITTCVASDRSVKHDIVAIDDSNLLDKVLGQRGVRFTYNEAKGAPGRRIGVIANDWEANFPELVDYDTDGVRHFDYAATWGLSVEMFRILRTDNDNLRAEVEALRRSIGR